MYMSMMWYYVWCWPLGVLWRFKWDMEITRFKWMIWRILTIIVHLTTKDMVSRLTILISSFTPSKILLSIWLCICERNKYQMYCFPSNQIFKPESGTFWYASYFGSRVWLVSNAKWAFVFYIMTNKKGMKIKCNQQW